MAEGDGLGWVYFIEAQRTDTVKIGWAAHSPEKRMVELQTGCPADLRLVFKIAGTAEDERRLHRHFHDRRVRGEWFQFDDHLRYFINHLRKHDRVPRFPSVHELPPDATLDTPQACSQCQRPFNEKRPTAKRYRDAAGNLYASCYLCLMDGRFALFHEVPKLVHYKTTQA